MWFFSRMRAQRAGHNAGLTWKKTLAHTGEDIETLTGWDLYSHAQNEADKWLRRVHSFTMDRTWGSPEFLFREQYLAYVESFLSEFHATLKSHRGKERELTPNKTLKALGFSLSARIDKYGTVILTDRVYSSSAECPTITLDPCQVYSLLQWLNALTDKEVTADAER